MDTTVAVTVKVDHTIDKDRLETLLISAFEGGSNYWVKWIKAVQGGDVYAAAFDYGVRVRADGEPHSRLVNMAAMRKGMQDLADKYPRHMADILSGNDDATTGDVFLQLCLFGELVYG
jgi:hypothetical protein